MLRAQLLNNFQGKAAVSCKNMAGQIHVRILPMPFEDYDQCVKDYAAGAMIQNAFSMLNTHDREFIKAGDTPSDWINAFDSDDEEEAEEDRKVLREFGPDFMTAEQYQRLYAGSLSMEEILAYNLKQIEAQIKEDAPSMAV